MPTRITEAVVASLAAKTSDRDEFVFDTLLSGYAIRRTPAGVIIHIASARAAGRKVRASVGHWPELKTSEARELARLAIADIKAGRDPALERRARQQAAVANGITLAAFSEQWMATHVTAKLKRKTALDYAQQLRQYILPALGHRLVADLTVADADALHIRMKDRPRAANYTLSTLRAIMRHAVRAGLRRDNPVSGIAQYPERPRERFLSPNEFAVVLKEIDAAAADGKITVPCAAGLKLALYTGARRSEVAAARWSDIDWSRRIIRLADSKTNTPRTIHLNDAAIGVLQSLPRRVDTAGVIAGAHRGRALGEAWRIIRRRCGLDDVRLHDLRHSFASLALASGVPLAMVGKLLGHKRASTTERYAHLAADDAAAANDVVGAALAAVTTAPTGGTVVKLPRRRARR
jgi:integrase